MRKDSPKKTQDASQTPYFKRLNSIPGKGKPGVARSKGKQPENYVAILGYD